MSNLNKVLLMGNLTRDPELKHTPKGTAVADMSIATNRRVKDGENWKEEVTFIDITAWGSTAENCAKYLSKGRGIFVEGRLQLETWDDKTTGNKRSKLKVIAESVQFLSKAEGKTQPAPARSQRLGRPSADSDDEQLEEEDSDIPF